MTAATKAAPQETVQGPTSAAAWKKNRTHTIMLPSGTTVQIEIPDLARLIETGEIPQNLLDVALKVAQTGRMPDPTPELATKQREFTDTVVKITVTQPKLTDEDLPFIPYEDKDLIVQLAMRERDIDAEGEHIGGLSKSDKFRAFRGLPSIDSPVEGD